MRSAVHQHQIQGDNTDQEADRGQPQPDGYIHWPRMPGPAMGPSCSRSAFSHPPQLTLQVVNLIAVARCDLELQVRCGGVHLFAQLRDESLQF